MKELKINFVHKNLNGWNEKLIDDLLRRGVGVNPAVFKEGRDVWVIQTYIALKMANYPNIFLSAEYKPDCINIAHRIDVRPVDCVDNFVVSIRADREPMFYSHVEVVQNATSVWAKNHHYVPHWPQPGLIPRDSRRGSTIRNISFFGKACHLKDELKDDFFIKSLQELSCTLCIHEDNWWDYSDTDLVLAVREGHRFYLDFKPASKLVNSWHAGCPVIVNYEAGYRELKKSDLDYIEADSPEKIIGLIKNLIEDRNKYSEMVENGFKRSLDFGFTDVVRCWITLIEEGIKPKYRKWESRGGELPIKISLRKIFNKVREKIWGWQSTQYPKSPSRLIISYLRVFLVFPGFWIAKLKLFKVNL